MSNRVRIGIDVGGTFTHAVAVTEGSPECVARVRVPTTHGGETGVAGGIIDALESLLAASEIQPDNISRVAHSTTQATNALLEGDVAKVGIIACGSGLQGMQVKTQTKVEPVQLAPGRNFTPLHRYLEITSDELDEEVLKKTIAELKEEGVKAIVAATAFSVDEPEKERAICRLATEMGLAATATCDLTSLYGLAVRTRTAAINAAILPKMVETARRTEEAVRALGIEAPLVVMRSDGGAMDIKAMKDRPVLTMLSGPAAGVAALLMAAGVADGIFLEVGGTSTDISCVRDGRPEVKPARIGGHRLYLNTLDVRTVGVAGGSLPRVRSSAIVGVGPRSAHIANLSYSSFSEQEGPLEVTSFAPLPLDPKEYVAFTSEDEPVLAITPTCAANFLGTVADGDYARGHLATVNKAFQALAEYLDIGAKEAAEHIMEVGVTPMAEVIEELVEEYCLSWERIRLFGGGGGAGVWLPAVGKRLKRPATVVEHAHVISAIGAALALLQETVERTLINPTAQDIASIRQAARQAVIASGAAPQTVEVRVDVDSQRGILSATAIGSHEMTTREQECSREELHKRAAGLMDSEMERTREIADLTRFVLYQSHIEHSSFFGLFSSVRNPWVLLEKSGRPRFSAADGEIVVTKANLAERELKELLERVADFNDAGMVLPACFLICNQRTVDLSGITDVNQRLTLCREELAAEDAESTVLLATKKS